MKPPNDTGDGGGNPPGTAPPSPPAQSNYSSLWLWLGIAAVLTIIAYYFGK